VGLCCSFWVVLCVLGGGVESYFGGLFTKYCTALRTATEHKHPAAPPTHHHPPPQLQAAKSAHRSALKQRGVYRDPFERAQQQADRVARSRPHVPSLLPPPSPNSHGQSGGGGTHQGPTAVGLSPGGQGAAAGGGGLQAAGFGGGAFGAGFGSPFPGTPGFGAQQGAAALGRSSSKSNTRPSKSRR